MDLILTLFFLSFFVILFLSRLQSLCSTATMQTVRAADTNEVDKLIFRESDNDRKVSYAALILPAAIMTCHNLNTVYNWMEAPLLS